MMCLVAVYIFILLFILVKFAMLFMTLTYVFELKHPLCSDSMMNVLPDYRKTLLIFFKQE